MEDAAAAALSWPGGPPPFSPPARRGDREVVASPGSGG